MREVWKELMNSAGENVLLVLFICIATFMLIISLIIYFFPQDHPEEIFRSKPEKTTLPNDAKKS